MIIKEFEKWMASCRKSTGQLLALSTVKHYSQGLKTTSDDMLSSGIIHKRLEKMNLHELDIAIFRIFNDSQFLAKDKKGNNMYSNSVKKFRAFIYLSSERGLAEKKEEEKIIKNPNISNTEKRAIIKARIGQGVFKRKLLAKYNSKCIVTRLSIKQALIASHIKPWSVCNNNERLDVNNGLLLSATFDRLFDSGLVTFKNDGEIVISDLITSNDKDILNIKQKNKYDIKSNSEMEKYLDYHNQYIFVGSV